MGVSESKIQSSPTMSHRHNRHTGGMFSFHRRKSPSSSTQGQDRHHKANGDGGSASKSSSSSSFQRQSNPIFDLLARRPRSTRRSASAESEVHVSLRDTALSESVFKSKSIKSSSSRAALPPPAISTGPSVAGGFGGSFYDGTTTATSGAISGRSRLSSVSSAGVFNATVQKIVDEAPNNIQYQQELYEEQQEQQQQQQRSDSPTAGSDTTLHHPFEPHFESERLLKNFLTRPSGDGLRRREYDRQQRQHYLLKYIWRANYNVPLQSPTFIINWCGGTGIWAMEMAQEFPECQVLGIDYETVTLESLVMSLPNLNFQNIIVKQGCTGLEEIEDNTVDYLMMRDVWMVNSPAFKWHDTLAAVLHVLKPNGWVEIYEQELRVHYPGPHFHLADEWYGKIISHMGIDRGINNSLGRVLEQVGYINIDKRELDLPIGEWPSVPALKETGYLFKDLMLRRFKISVPWICCFNNLDPKYVKDTIDKAFAECDEHKTCMRWLYYAAQKPSESGPL